MTWHLKTFLGAIGRREKVKTCDSAGGRKSLRYGVPIRPGEMAGWASSCHNALYLVHSQPGRKGYLPPWHFLRDEMNYAEESLEHA